MITFPIWLMVTPSGFKRAVAVNFHRKLPGRNPPLHALSDRLLRDMGVSRGDVRRLTAARHRTAVRRRVRRL